MAGILLGRNGAILLGKQTAEGTKQTTLINKVFQTSGDSGIGPQADFNAPTLNDGSLAPNAPVIGQARSEGSLQILQSANGLGTLLEALMLANATSAQYHAGLWNILAATQYTVGTALTSFVSNSQPKDKLQNSTFITGGTITGVNAAKLKFTFDGSPTIDTTKTSQLVVKGFDQAVSADGTRKRPATEVIPLVAGDLSTPFFSNNYFSEITSVTVEGLTGGSNPTIKIEGDGSAYYKHVIESGETRQFYTMEAILGGSSGVPNTFMDVQVGQGGFTIGDYNEFNLSLQGGAFFLRENVRGNTSPTNFSAYTRPSANVATGWGTVLYLNDKFYRCGEAGFDINHNFGQDENPFARDAYVPAGIQTDKREVTVNARINLEKGDDFDFDQYAWGRDLKIMISSASMDFGAANALMNVEFPNCRLTQFPMPGSFPAGQLSQQLAASAYRDGTTKEVKITIVNTETGAQFG